MSVSKRVTFSDNGEPIVAITITGWDDAFRFSWAMAHLQCEFNAVARRIGGSLKRHLGAKRFQELHSHYTSGPCSWARDEQDDAEMLKVIKQAANTLYALGEGQMDSPSPQQLASCRQLSEQLDGITVALGGNPTSPTFIPWLPQ